MDFYITDTCVTKKITVCPWNGDSYGADCFGEMETNFPRYHKERHGDAIVCSLEDFVELAEWWNDEIDSMNATGLSGSDELAITIE